jgi:hypothetical protein
VACVFFTAMNDLEVLAVQMEGMSSRVIVVEDDFHNLAVFEDKGICVGSVNGWIGSILAGGENGV